MSNRYVDFSRIALGMETSSPFATGLRTVPRATIPKLQQPTNEKEKKRKTNRGYIRRTQEDMGQ